MYCDSKLSLQVGLTPEIVGERVVSLSVLKLSMLGVDETCASVSMSGETLPVVSTLMSFGGSPGSGVLQAILMGEPGIKCCRTCFSRIRRPAILRR